MISFFNIWAFALLPLPALIWWLAPALPARSAVAVPASVMATLTSRSGARSDDRIGPPAGLILRIIGWLALVLALAGPHQERAPLLSPSGRDVAVALDLSASMAETDMSGNGVTRITLIRDVLGDFVRGRKGDRVSLIGFGTEAYVIAPLTFDVGAAAEMLDEVTIGLPGRRTDLGQAIGLSVQMMREEPAGERLLILISDGETNVGALAAADAARLAADAGLKVFVIGFAKDLDAGSEDQMRGIAEATGGQFFAASDPVLLQAIYREIDLIAPVSAPDPERAPVENWRWAPLLLAFAAALIIGWREHLDP